MLLWLPGTVPPAELAMVSTRSERALSFLSPDRLRLFLWSVAVVMTNSPLANPVFRGKSGIMRDTIVKIVKICGKIAILRCQSQPLHAK